MLYLSIITLETLLRKLTCPCITLREEPPPAMFYTTPCICLFGWEVLQAQRQPILILFNNACISRLIWTLIQRFTVIKFYLFIRYPFGASHLLNHCLYKYLFTNFKTIFVILNTTICYLLCLKHALLVNSYFSYSMCISNSSSKN